MKLWIDRETFNDLDLTVVGTYKYAETAEDLIITYAIDDEPAKIWDLTDRDRDLSPPADLWFACLEADEVWAHHAQFDRMVHKYQSALPQIELERWRCSMSMALSHALPAGLDSLCDVLDVPSNLAKVKEGKKLIRRFCQPSPSNHKVRRYTRHTHPEEWARFRAYALADIEAMRACVDRIPRWNWDDECIAEYHCDQRINERGFYADRELVAAGRHAADTEKVRLAESFTHLVNHAFRPSQRPKLLAHLQSKYGLLIDDTKKDTFEQLLKHPERLDPNAAEIMRIVAMANKTSTAKYAALEPAIQKDGRFRGGAQFAGAGRTRRFAGRLFQFQNLPARGLPKHDLVNEYIGHLKDNVHDLFHDNLMGLASAALRGVVIAPPTKKLVVSDLSNIEGRKLAWYAGEEWKLEAFRKFDTITGFDEKKNKPIRLGPDLYNVTAVSLIGGDPWNVPKADRNVFGKVPDLACGYQGGVAGFQTFAKVYGVRMAEHWEGIRQRLSEFVPKAELNLGRFGRKQMDELEISEEEWMASETCKVAWRARHPATVRLWYSLEGAMMDAIRAPGMKIEVGRLQVKSVRYKKINWLVIRLASGRFLTYFEPRLVPGFGDKKQIAYEGEAAEKGSTNRIWTVVYTHGGKATGNVCQASARDILMPALRTADARGYAPVFSVHDEAVCETDDTNEFTAEGLNEILVTQHDWTDGLPLAAAGMETDRYYKED